MPTSKKTFEKNTEAQVNAVNIKTLSDRPNVVSRYGTGGLSATQLKERFDGFPALNREKINQIIDILNGPESTKYLGIGTVETDALSEFGVDNLYDLLVKMTTSDIADVLKVDYMMADDAQAVAYTLQKAISDIIDVNSNQHEAIMGNADEIEAVKNKAETEYGNIAAAFNEHLGKIEANQSNISNHEGRIEALESWKEPTNAQVIKNANSLVDHLERIKGLEGDNTSNKNRISTLEGDNTINKSNIGVHSERINKLEAAYETLEGVDATVDANITSIAERLATAESTVKTASENVEKLSGDVNTHLAQSAKNFAIYDSKFSEYDTAIAGVSSYDERISEVEATVSGYDAEIEKVSGFDDRITGIETYLGGENFVIDDSEHYMKTVPNNACETAKLLKIGTGTTYEVIFDEGNLFPYPYTEVVCDDEPATEENGAVTFSTYSNRLIAGYIKTNKVTFPAGTYILDIGNSYFYDIYFNTSLSPHDIATTRIGNGKMRIEASIAWSFSGINLEFEEVTEQTLYPVLYLESEPIEWQARGVTELRHAKVTELRSVGKNLIDVSQALNEDFYDLGDGEYGFSRAAESKVFPLYLPGNGHMLRFTGTRVGGGSDLTLNLYYNYPAVNISEDIKGVSMNSSFSLSKDVQYASFVCSGGREPGITVAHLQLAYGASVTDYEPFSGASLFEIPNEVQELDSFGSAANPKVAAMEPPSENAFCNYIEYRNGGWFYVKRSHKMVLVGEENWEKPSRGSVRLVVPEAAWVDLYTPRDEWSQLWGMAGPLPLDVKDEGIDNSVSIGYGHCVLNVDGLDTVDDVKQYLADLNNRGTPLTVVYALEYPEEIEISNLMPRPALLGVAPGRYIFTKQDNDKHFDIPTSIKYLVYYQKGETL